MRRLHATAAAQIYDSDVESENITSEEEDNVDDEEQNLEHELANEVTFEELLKAKSNGSVSLHTQACPEKKKRANKKRPTEVSCKKPVSRFRDVVQVPKKMNLDPRFESLFGNYNVEGFRKRYNFLYESNLPKEKHELVKQLKKSKDPGAIEDLKRKISWIDKQMSYKPPKEADNAILSQHKRNEREAVKMGKRPFYLKKSEIRKQKLIEKYNKLKASGKIDSFIEKKRKRTASKQHKHLPDRRLGNSDSL